MTAETLRATVLSDDFAYRYRLYRDLGGDLLGGVAPGGRQPCCFIMLNPSTADAAVDDLTVRRCKGFARACQADELFVVNLFAYRATDPADMRRAADPVGPDNRDHVCDVARAVRDACGPVICAWGVGGDYLDQDLAVMTWLADLDITPFCLGVSKDGHPLHPSRLPSTAELTPFVSRRAA